VGLGGSVKKKGLRGKILDELSLGPKQGIWEINEGKKGRKFRQGLQYLSQ